MPRGRKAHLILLVFFMGLHPDPVFFDDGAEESIYYDESGADPRGSVEPVEDGPFKEWLRAARAREPELVIPRRPRRPNPADRRAEPSPHS